MSTWKKTLLSLALAAALIIPAVAQETQTFGIDKAARPEAGLVVAGQPTAEQLKEAAKAGFKTVIDLRMPDEPRGYDEANAAHAAGLAYVRIPLNLDTLNAEALEQFLAAMSHAEGPVLLHCATANRAGALYYAQLLEKGAPEAEALSKAQAAGLKSQELTERVNALVDARRKPRQ